MFDAHPDHTQPLGGRIRIIQHRMRTIIVATVCIVSPLIAAGVVLLATHAETTGNVRAEAGLTALVLAGQAILLAAMAGTTLLILQLGVHLTRQMTEQTQAFNSIAEAAGDQLEQRRRRRDHG
jgi:hypothetical protein